MSKQNGQAPRRAGKGLADLIAQVVGQVLPGLLAAALECEHHAHIASPAFAIRVGESASIQGSLQCCCRCGRALVEYVGVGLDPDAPGCGSFVRFRPVAASQLLLVRSDAPLPPFPAAPRG